MAPAQQTFTLAAPPAESVNGAARSVELAPIPGPPAPAGDTPPPPAPVRPAAKKAGGARKAAGGRSRSGTAPAGRRAPRRPAVVVSRWERFVVTAGIMVVRLAAAVVSYEHMRSLASEAGEGWRSVLLPLSVDGLAVVALVTIRLRKRAGEPTNWFAWLALGLSLAASLGANIAAADPTWAGRLVAAWPPLALGLAEVVNQHRPAAPASTHVAAPVRSGPSKPKAGKRRSAPTPAT